MIQDIMHHTYIIMVPAFHGLFVVFSWHTLFLLRSLASLISHSLNLTLLFKEVYRCRPYRVDIWRNHRHRNMFDICRSFQSTLTFLVIFCLWHHLWVLGIYILGHFLTFFVLGIIFGILMSRVFFIGLFSYIYRSL